MKGSGSTTSLATGRLVADIILDRASEDPPSTVWVGPPGASLRRGRGEHLIGEAPEGSTKVMAGVWMGVAR